MKTLTVKQPWALLIVSGIKDVENRSWKTNYRGRVFIHSSGKSLPYNTRLFNDPQLYEIGSKIVDITSSFCKESTIIGSVEIVDCVRNYKSIWAEKDVWNWALANPVMFEYPIVGVKGKLRLWEYVQSDISEDTCQALIDITEKMRNNCVEINKNINYGK